MCLFLCYTPITSPSVADSFYFVKQFGTGKPCVICHDKTRLVEFRLRGGSGAKPRLTAGTMVRQRVKEDPPGRGDNVFVHTPITRPAA